jgi:hypothetical protein
VFNAFCTRYLLALPQRLHAVSFLDEFVGYVFQIGVYFHVVDGVVVVVVIMQELFSVCFEGLLFEFDIMVLFRHLPVTILVEQVNAFEALSFVYLLEE